MIVEVDIGEYTTLVKFYKKDLTSTEEIQRIASAFATSYCFDAMSLLSPEFEEFITNLKPRTQYGIMVGYDPGTDDPVVRWGKVQRAPAEYL